jgi:hypothetical protein
MTICPTFQFHFSTALQILTTSETNKIDWNETSLQSFDNLKNAMSQIYLLRYRNPLKRLYLQSDKLIYWSWGSTVSG